MQWKELASVLNSLRFSQMKSLSQLFLVKPLWIFPTAKATATCMQMCERLFPKIHHGHGKENAFRHIMWNALLVREFYYHSSNLEKSSNFADKVTAWHENFSPNPPLEHAMDVHNNALGRIWATEWLNNKIALENDSLETLILVELSKAKQLIKPDDIKNHKGLPVYISN